MTYERREGLYQLGTDAAGRGIWRIRGRVDGVAFDERFHGTKTDARRRLHDLRSDAAKGNLSKSSGETVEDFFADYIANRIRMGKLREGKPANAHRGVVRNWLVPNLPKKLTDVRPQHVQKVADAMIDAGRTRSTPQARALLVGGFRWAQQQRKVALNPTEGVSWPEVHRPDRPALTPAQVVKILEKAPEEYRVPLALDAATGLRASELSALRWSDVELDGGTNGCPTYPHLHVDGGMQRVGGSFVRTSPKSSRGRRWVPLSPSAVSMLRRYRKEQTTRRLSLGEAWADGDLVIDAGDGKPLDPGLLGKAFRAAATLAKVSGFHFHDLRHYFVTQAVNADLDAATVSRMAGHATVAFTLQVYFHPSEETAAPLGAAVDAALGETLGGF